MTRKFECDVCEKLITVGQAFTVVQTDTRTGMLENHVHIDCLSSKDFIHDLILCLQTDGVYMMMFRRQVMVEGYESK